MSIVSIQSTEAQIRQHLSALIAAALSAGGYFSEGVSQDVISTAFNRIFIQADEECKSFMKTQICSAAPTPKSRKKSSKPRKRTAYNMYVKTESASIREELKRAADPEPLARGSTMKEAAVRWKLLDESARAQYVTLADEFNATLKTAQVTGRVSPVVPPTEYAELAGPYPNTYALGVVNGAKKSFKTLGDAVVALRNHPNAAAIVQAKNDGLFKLRAGFSGKGNHSNVDANGENTPGFIYNANTGECTWARKSAIILYADQGPFTKSAPFRVQDAVTTVAHPQPAAGVVEVTPQVEVTTPDATPQEEVTSGASATPQDAYQSEYDDDEEFVEENVRLYPITHNGTEYLCLPSGHLLSFHEDEDPRQEHYTGKKIVGDVVQDAVYDAVVDGGPLPDEYVALFAEED